MRVRSAQRVLVIIPCRNEAGRVGPVVHAVRQVLPDGIIAVVDDESNDTTRLEAETAGALVLRHPVNLGYGAALETGYLFALEKGFDAVVQMDGDGQHPADDLKTLLEPIIEGTADIVIGSRFLSADAPMRVSVLRRFGQTLFGCLVFLITGRRISDPTSGFQALGRRALRLFASGVFPCDYPDADVVTMAHLAGLRIREVGVRMKPRAGGTSMHSGIKPIYYGMKMLLSIFIVMLNRRAWRRWRRANALAPVGGLHHA